MLSTPTSPISEAYPLPGIFRAKPIGSWVAVAALILLILMCCAVFFGFVETRYEGYWAPNIEADSDTYYQIAGVAASNFEGESQPSLISFDGNLLGPVLIAKALRYPFLVAIFNTFLLMWMVHTAGKIPGLRRRYFVLLFFLNAESFVAIVSLNKEILAAFGLVALAVAFSRPSKQKRYIALAAVFSLMARWEQLAILLLYLLLESRFSPFRRRHKLSLAFLLGILTIMYTAIVRYSGINLAGFLAVAETSGTIARLDNIQANFGLPLVIVPKILMNLFNRFLLPEYFVSSDFFASDFSELQGSIIIHLHTLAMLILMAVAFAKRRLGVSRPVPYLIYLYLLITAVSPFIQPRYEYPVYILLCLQLSISPEFFPKRLPRVVNSTGDALLAPPHLFE
jgi:hypothetical protein